MTRKILLRTADVLFETSMAQVKRCKDGWCRVTGSGFDGWIEQQRLWGVYADEKIE